MKDLKRYASIIMSFALMALPVAGPLIPVFGAPSESFDHDGSFGYMYTGDQIIDGIQYHFSTGTEEGLPEGALKRQS